MTALRQLVGSLVFVAVVFVAARSVTLRSVTVRSVAGDRPGAVALLRSQGSSGVDNKSNTVVRHATATPRGVRRAIVRRLGTAASQAAWWEREGAVWEVTGSMAPRFRAESSGPGSGFAGCCIALQAFQFLLGRIQLLAGGVEHLHYVEALLADGHELGLLPVELGLRGRVFPGPAGF